MKQQKRRTIGDMNKVQRHPHSTIYSLPLL
jgi:hypothetical protein